MIELATTIALILLGLGVAAALSQAPAATFEDALYNAVPETVLELVRESPRSALNVLMVGHNPTLTYFLGHLIGRTGADGDANPTLLLRRREPRVSGLRAKRVRDRE